MIYYKMKSTRNKTSKYKKRTNKRATKNRRKHYKSNKRTTSAVDVAQKILKKTGSLQQARVSFRLKALQNTRNLFGFSSEHK